MEISTKIRTIISDNFGVRLCDIAEEDTRDSLGMDSLDEVEFIMCLEEEFDIEIPDEEGEKIVSLQDAVNLVKSMQ
jgi:acyl carrier protein